MDTFQFQTPFGGLEVQHEDEIIHYVVFVQNAQETSSLTSVQKKIKKSFHQYLTGKLNTIEIPFQLKGTPYQQKVWRALKRIPYGHTVSYGELAKSLKSSARA